MKDILNRMLNHEELSREEMKNILIGITQSEYPTEQITALLTALQMRGVTVDELLGFRDINKLVDNNKMMKIGRGFSSIINGKRMTMNNKEDKYGK